MKKGLPLQASQSTLLSMLLTILTELGYKLTDGRINLQAFRNDMDGIKKNVTGDEIHLLFDTAIAAKTKKDALDGLKTIIKEVEDSLNQIEE
jgi:hypothetical protein